MALTAARTAVSLLTDLRSFARRNLTWHPELWVYAVALGATFALVGGEVVGDQATPPGGNQHGPPAAHPATILCAIVGADHSAGAGTWIAEFARWTAMVLAMMLWVVAPDARRVAMHSLWRRRHRAMTCFVLGYVAVWLVVGVALTGVLVAIRQPRPGTAASVAALLVAAAWQISRPRRRTMRRCGALRVPATQRWQGDRDCVAIGSLVGLRCTFMCGPVMLAMALSHSLVLMGGVLVLLLTERGRGPNPSSRVGRPLEAGWLVAFASTVAAVAVAT